MLIVDVDSIASFSMDRYSKIPISGSNGLLRLLCFEPNQGVPLHSHTEADEYFLVMKGKGEITVGEKKATVEAGCMIEAPAGVNHRWKNGAEELMILSVLVPPSSYKLADKAMRMELI